MNGVNDDQVGPILDFVIQEQRQAGRRLLPAGLVHGPRRRDQRRRPPRASATRCRTWRTTSTATRAARSTATATGIPLGAMGAFGALADHFVRCKGPRPELRRLACSCHPNCGASFIVVPTGRPRPGRRSRSSSTWRVHARTSQSFATRRAAETLTLDPRLLSPSSATSTREGPGGFTLRKFVEPLLQREDGAASSARSNASRTGRSSGSAGCGSRILDATISGGLRCASFRTPRRRARSPFCAYNTGVGWRQIVENMHYGREDEGVVREPRQAPNIHGGGPPRAARGEAEAPGARLGAGSACGRVHSRGGGATAGVSGERREAWCQPASARPAGRADAVLRRGPGTTVARVGRSLSSARRLD